MNRLQAKLADFRSATLKRCLPQEIKKGLAKAILLKYHIKINLNQRFFLVICVKMILT